MVGRPSFWNRPARAGGLLAFAGLFALASAACKGHAPDVASSARTDDLEGGGELAALEAIDGATDASELRIYALASPTPICSGPAWPPHDPTKASDERMGVIRLGYMRKGQSVLVKPSVLKKPNCSEGWYELVAGGFVCGKYATLDPNAKELADAPHAPYADGPLPYDYGLNLTNGTPLYSKVPKRRQRDAAERDLGTVKTKSEGTSDGDGAGDVPWYLQDHKGERPQVTIDELHKENGPVAMRVVRGFYLALDKELKTFSGRYWRTTHGLLVPVEHVLVHKASTEFEGVWVGHDDEPRKLPLGFILGFHARKNRIDDEHLDPVTGEKKVRRPQHADRFTIVALTGKKETVEGRDYFETTEGWWMRDIDGTVTNPGPKPPDLLPGEKWIDVNLTTQTLVAFEGDKPVFATLLSSGKRDDTDKSKDHHTVTGNFRIREKHISSTMDDDGASDGPYSIEDVPWIMYFQGSYALHGAFWHSAFGHERSHGCVNLEPHDARVLFGWVGPTLPDGWHGVRATEANPGTRVIVHQDPPDPKAPPKSAGPAGSAN